VKCPICNGGMDDQQGPHGRLLTCRSNECDFLNIAFPASQIDAIHKLVAATTRAARRDALANGSPWMEALTEAAAVNWTLAAESAGDPRKMLADLLGQARKEALDPAISPDAKNLVEQGRQEALEAAFNFMETWEPLINPSAGDKRETAQEIASDARRYYHEDPRNLAILAPDPARAITAWFHAQKMTVPVGLLEAVCGPAPTPPTACPVCGSGIARAKLVGCIACGWLGDA